MARIRCVILFREQSMATATKPVSIQDFVAQLRKFPESAFDETEHIRRFLQDSPLNPDSLAHYLTWDRQHYTRNLIDKNPLYELVAVCWEVGQASSVHNHRDQNCWMAVPIGRLLVENFHVVHQRAVSVHVYSRPFDTCVVYSAEQGTCGEIELHYTTEYGKPARS